MCSVLHWTDIRTGMRAAWVREYQRGIAECRATCPYFAFCGGGHPSNRYFELGRMDGTETDYCRNSKIALIEGIMLLTSRWEAGKSLEPHRCCAADKWDNRPVWDNWNKSPENPFDNRPTWDNWDKR